jgi:uncharacterized protein (TIGR03435 family)
MRRDISKLIPIVLVCLAAQGQTAKPTFEAASIKTATPLGPLGMRSDWHGGPGTSDPGTFRCLNCTLYSLVKTAYGIRFTFGFSGPDWLQSLRFDVSAKVAAGATKEAFQGMMQVLLSERFKLVVHREMKQMQVYELTVGKNGPKFKEAVPKDAPHDDDPPPAKLKRDSDGFPILTPGMSMAMIPGRARVRSENQPIEWFTEMLSVQLQCPVLDATGLKANYDFTLSWAFEDRSSASPPDIGGAPPAAELESYIPSLITAVESQLGLKLQQRKGQAEVLVVDHMEKVPTEN